MDVRFKTALSKIYETEFFIILVDVHLKKSYNLQKEKQGNKKNEREIHACLATG